MTSQGLQRVSILAEMLQRDGLFLVSEVPLHFRTLGHPVPDRKTVKREVDILTESGDVATATVSLLNKTNVSKTDYTVVYITARYPGGTNDGFMAKVPSHPSAPLSSSYRASPSDPSVTFRFAPRHLSPFCLDLGSLVVH